jgi:urea transporter
MVTSRVILNYSASTVNTIHCCWFRSMTMATLLSHQSARFSVRFSAPRLRFSYTSSSTINRRCFGTDSSKEDNSDNDNDEKNISPPAWQDTTDSAAKGVGQVIFLNDRRAGAFVLGSLALGDPYLALLAGTGTVVANATAARAGLDTNALQNGLFGYNGCLVGCATAVFIYPIADPTTASSISTLVAAGIWTTTGAAASTIVAASLPGALGKVPQFTLAFNLVTLSVLLQTRPLAAATDAAATVTATDRSTLATVTPAAADAVITMGQQLLAATLHGLSQIFVVESALTGAGVLVAIASYSPQLAAHALVGSLVGSLTGVIACGAAPGDIAAGLWGYNSALTSMAVGVFFVSDNLNHHFDESYDNPNVNRQVAVTALSIGGAAATAVVFGAMQTVFGAAGAPCLTLPFCLTASGCYLLANVVPGLQLAANPHSPEKNQV